MIPGSSGIMSPFLTFNGPSIYIQVTLSIRGIDMSSITDSASKNERDIIAAEISEILKDAPVVGYRDEKGVLVLPADDDEDY